MSGFFSDHIGMSAEHLLVVGRRYIAARGITLATLATYAAADGRFFARLAEGRVTLRRVDAVAGWISSHWPEHLEWPPGVPRPEPSPASEAKEAA